MRRAAPGIVVVWSGTRPMRLALRAPLVFGRNQLADTDDDRISREHVRIGLTDAGLTVEDAGSRNGTHLYGASCDGLRAGLDRGVVRTGRTVAVLLDDVRPFEDVAVDDRDPIRGARTAEHWRKLERALDLTCDVVIRGENGVGRRTMATRFARAAAFDPANPDVPEGIQTLIVERLESLDAAHLAVLDKVLTRHSALRLVATAGPAYEPHDGRLGRRLANALALDLPPLRDRIDELPRFALAAIRGSAHRLRLHATLIEACLLRVWLDNIPELVSVIETTAATLLGRNATVFRGEDLPPNAGSAHSGSQDCRMIPAEVVERAIADAHMRLFGERAKVAVDDDPRATALRDAVWADPDSDHEREVYADCLIEHGDPRGELIALQLARVATGTRASTRELELLEQLAADCAQPLTRYLRPGFTLRRGFLATCEVDDDVDMPPEIASHPAWSTVEAIETNNSVLLDAGSLRAHRLGTSVDLARVTGNFETIVGRSRLTPGDRVVSRGIWLQDDVNDRARLPDVTLLSELMVTTRLPKLCGLGVYILQDHPLATLDTLVTSPLGAQLEHLEVLHHDSPRDLPRFRELFARSKLERLTVRLQLHHTPLDPLVALDRNSSRLKLELGGQLAPNSDPERLVVEMITALGRDLSTIEIRDLIAPHRIAETHRTFIDLLRPAFRDIVLVDVPLPSMAL